MDNDNILSITELNNLLDGKQDRSFSGLRNGRRDFYLGKEIAWVDIAFVAGLLLFYEEEKNEKWRKIDINYTMKEDKNKRNSFALRTYFRQYKKLYGTDWNAPFARFSYLSSQNDDGDLFSRQFAPILYITEKTIGPLFGKTTGDPDPIFRSNLELVKKEYDAVFDIDNFLKRFTKTTKSTISTYRKEFVDKLNRSSPLFSFVFIVAAYNLVIAHKSDFKYFPTFKKYIEKLWQFTEDFVSGLYELAKNIVEHSGNIAGKGQGMITIRAYYDGEENEGRVFKTHVFDYGRKGIIPTLIEDTDKKCKELDNLYKESNKLDKKRFKEVLACYEADQYRFRNAPYELRQFIEAHDLGQQLFRHTSHYGIDRLNRLIKSPINGEIWVASQGQCNRDYYGNDAAKYTLNEGTHYYLEIPFVAENFKNVALRAFHNPSTAALDNEDSMKTLLDMNSEEVSLDLLSNKYNRLLNNTLLIIKINGFEVSKANIDSIYEYLHHLYTLESETNIIAIDCQYKIKDSSILLRFLSTLTFAYDHSFIVYNVDYDIYREMLEDNKSFFESRKQAYWHESKGILLYIKTDKDFYFADLLFGEYKSDFQSINKIVSQTFPNTIAILEDLTNLKELTNSDTGLTIPSNSNLFQLFLHEKYLYPFDAILKDKNGRPLFLSNVTTILNNNLLKQKGDRRTPNKYFDDYERHLLNEFIVNGEGYHLEKTHFKIGNKVHSEDFYYAKRLFQNSFYTTRLALRLALDLKDELTKLVNKSSETKRETPSSSLEFEASKSEKILLIGYEMYSELLLSMTEYFLKKIVPSSITIEHIIAHNNDKNRWDFFPQNVFSNFLKHYADYRPLIIIPIAATGSTAPKIKKGILRRIRGQEYKCKFDELMKKIKEDQRTEDKIREIAKEAKEYADKIVEKLEKDFFLQPSYNVILAQPSEGFDEERKPSSDTEQQTSMIRLEPKWHKLEECPLCGFKEGEKQIKTKPLFDTDSSSLTPSLIFENPKGKTLKEDCDKVSPQPFSELTFDNSLRYQSVNRNNNYRLFAVDPNLFIEDNLDSIKEWLRKIKDHLYPEQTNPKQTILKITDRVTIVAPCHESNLKFLTLINDIVFNSSATIIHHQNDVDATENFKLLNESYLKDSHVFYVDDALITGEHFWDTLSLINEITSKRLRASIILLDEAEASVHDRVAKASMSYFSFATYNQPPSLNGPGKYPLQRERDRYQAIQKRVMHDVLRDHFNKKANKLNPEKRQNDNDKVTDEKKIRRLSMFEATHKIYDYFANGKNKDIPDLADENERDKFVKFILTPKNLGTIDDDTRQKALLKVLSQSFIFYRELSEKAFEWHKTQIKLMLESIIGPNKRRIFEKRFKETEFTTFKFLLRRATFLGNNQVVQEGFLSILFGWFFKIDQFLKITYKDNGDNDQKYSVSFPPEKAANLRDFPIYVLGNYIEMIHRNAWVAPKLLTAIQKGLKTLKQKTTIFGWNLTAQGELFIRMLQIEAATVIDDAIEMIAKEYPIKWRDMYIGQDKLDTTLSKIRTFLDTHKDEIFETNKCRVAVKVISPDAPTYDGLLENEAFINYLWVKQLLYADCIAKNSFLPNTIDLQQKVNAILDKMKQFFPKEKDIHAFYVVTDNLQKEHVLYKDDSVYLREREILSLFLKDDQTKNMPETTKEFLRNDGTWKDLYLRDDAGNLKNVDITSMTEDFKWIYLMRLSRLSERKDEDCQFEAQGLLGFCSSDDLSGNEYILPKQLLMLLRHDMSEFVSKHHKNDEFAELIREQEKDLYALALNHGVQTYKVALKQLIIKCMDDGLREELSTFYEYLILKIKLIDRMLSNDPHLDKINLNDISKEFNNKYVTVLSLNINGAYLNKDNIPSIVKLVCFNEQDLLQNNAFVFPKGAMKDIVFELLNNIRKHTCNIDTWKISKEDPLLIKCEIIEEGGNTYLSVSNNHVKNIGRKPQDNSAHGIDLLRQMWSINQIGQIVTSSYPLTDSSFTIKIQLKKYEEEKSTDN
jgi:hypothetical protein